MNDFCESRNASQAVEALQADLRRLLLQPEAIPSLNLGGSAELQKALAEFLRDKHGVTKAELFGFGLQVAAAGTVAEFLRARGELEEENHGQ